MNEKLKGAHLWLVMMKASRAIEKIDREGIQSLDVGGVSEFAVLEILLHKGEMPVNTIGRKILLTSGSATAAIDRLEKRGYVFRRPCKDDRRVVIVSLTDEGQRFIASQYKAHEERLEKIFSPLDGGERESLLALMKKVGKHAEQL